MQSTTDNSYNYQLSSTIAQLESDLRDANDEIDQLTKQAILTNQIKQIKLSVEEMKHKIYKSFGIEIPKGAKVTRPDSNKFMQNTAKNLWFTTPGKRDHELWQSFTIKENLFDAQGLLSDAETLYDYVVNNLGINSQDVVEFITSPHTDFTTDTSYDYRPNNQREQNIDLTEIGNILNSLLDVGDKIMGTFGNSLHRHISDQNIAKIEQTLNIDIYLSEQILEKALDSHNMHIIGLILPKCSPEVLSAQLSDGTYPISRFITNNRMDLLDYILDIGLDHSNLLLGLELALNNENYNAIGLILPKCSPEILNSPFSDGSRLIEKIVTLNHVDSLKSLLENGADSNVIIPDDSTTTDLITYTTSFFCTMGTTPLHLAIKRYYSSNDQMRNEITPIIEALLEHESTQINIPDKSGETAYQMIESHPNLKGRLSHIELSEKNTESYSSKTIHNLWFQYGFMAGKLLVNPAIDCFDRQVTHHNNDESFYQCYKDSFTINHAIQALKYPALSLILQDTIAPAYSMLGLACLELLKEESITWGKTFNIIGGIAVNSIAYSYIGQQAIYKDHPFLVGISSAAVAPALQAVGNALTEGYNQFMGDNSDNYADL